jgi:hypothetical protein
MMNGVPTFNEERATHRISFEQREQRGETDRQGRVGSEWARFRKNPGADVGGFGHVVEGEASNRSS